MHSVQKRNSESSRRSSHDRQRFVDTNNRQVGCFGDTAVRNVISHSAQQLDETLGASVDDACFAQHIELLSGFLRAPYGRAPGRRSLAAETRRRQRLLRAMQ